MLLLSQVFYGGDAELRTLTMLHPHGEVLSGAKQVTDGLWVGGYMSDAAQLVRTGAAAAHDFVFFRGRLEWQATELAELIQGGEWLRAGNAEQTAARESGAAPEWDGWASPERCGPGTLESESTRLHGAYRTWAEGMASCGAAYGAMTRMRPEVLQQIIVRAAHMPPAIELSEESPLQRAADDAFSSLTNE